MRVLESRGLNNSNRVPLKGSIRATLMELQ